MRNTRTEARRVKKPQSREKACNRRPVRRLQGREGTELVPCSPVGRVHSRRYQMRTIRRRAAGSAVLALALAVAGCASGGREIDDVFDGSSPEAQEAQLTAQNQNFS